VSAGSRRDRWCASGVTYRAAVPWQTPEFPHDPRDEPSLQTIDEAWLSRVRQGRLRTWERPDRWMTGAVYDARGRLVVESQKVGGLGGNREVMSDPLRLNVERSAERLDGTWLYGGHWFSHFGHFFTETVTTLWPPDLEVEGLVFHQYVDQQPGVEDWQRRLLELAGYGDLPVRVVAKEPIRVERLVVPSRSIVLNGWAHPGCVDVWRRISANLPDQGSWPARVYLSRTAYNESLRQQGRRERTSSERDHGLDAAFESAGFDVVAPETLPVDDQIRLARSADVLAGQAGTALHLAAFARPGTRVIELGDQRSHDRHMPTQLVINTICGHRQAFIEPDVAPEKIQRRLEELGLRPDPGL
jgi:capsular polysaccharide biosynthesis protein